MVTLSSFDGKGGLQFSGLEWLFTHHKSKESDRRKMVADLGLLPGSVVLDLGCGPGLWTPLLAEQVGPTGRVIGIDFDPNLIDFANRNKGKSPLANNIEFKIGNFYDIPFPDETFDAVFFANCLVYVTEPSGAMREQQRVTKQGGRLIGNHFDDALVIYHPIEPEFSMKILAATARSLAEQPPSPPFDNYAGRKLHGLFTQAGLKEVTTTTYITQKLYPLTIDEKRYISTIAEWQVATGASYLSSEDLKRWRSYFDETSSQYILDKKNFYYCMTDMQTMARK